mgnify:CR=1 FL=1
MAKIDESELGDDFRYILRLAMSDVDGMKPIGLGLTSINGVGKRTATALCEIAGVNNKKLGGHLSDEELSKLGDAIESYPTQVPNWMLNISTILSLCFSNRSHSRVICSLSNCIFACAA